MLDNLFYFLHTASFDFILTSTLGLFSVVVALVKRKAIAKFFSADADPEDKFSLKYILDKSREDIREYKNEIATLKKDLADKQRELDRYVNSYNRVLTRANLMENIIKEQQSKIRDIQKKLNTIEKRPS